MLVVKGLAHVSETKSLKMTRKMSTILSPLTLVASPVVTSFLAGCSRFPPSFTAGDDTVAGSSARIVSSFDSTPARKEPHLDEALNGPEDAISDYVTDCNDARSIKSILEFQRLMVSLLGKLENETTQQISSIQTAVSPEMEKLLNPLPLLFIDN